MVTNKNSYIARILKKWMQSSNFPKLYLGDRIKGCLGNFCKMSTDGDVNEMGTRVWIINSARLMEKDLWKFEVICNFSGDRYRHDRKRWSSESRHETDCRSPCKENGRSFPSTSRQRNY